MTFELSFKRWAGVRIPDTCCEASSRTGPGLTWLVSEPGAGGGKPQAQLPPHSLQLESWRSTLRLGGKRGMNGSDARLMQAVTV